MCMEIAYLQQVTFFGEVPDTIFQLFPMALCIEHVSSMTKRIERIVAENSHNHHVNIQITALYYL